MISVSVCFARVHHIFQVGLIVWNFDISELFIQYCNTDNLLCAYSRCCQYQIRALVKPMASV